MEPLLGVAAIVLVAWLSQGETHTDRVVLLPDETGKVGKVLVKTVAGEQALTTAYAGARVGASGAIDARSEDAAEVRQRYAAVLAARPPQAKSYMVNFVSGDTELTAESAQALSELKADLAHRPAPEIVVIGHTDSVGTIEANDALSLRRAALVRALLAAQGVAESSIEVAGRGEREPLVPVGDEVAEPRNRRVEINVR
jgi:outer membrane protein OmpA-like peptidoglycan-associated protein